MAAGNLPQRPYLLRAMHAWITDNGQTPHVVVDAAFPGVQVPQQYVRDGKIVLNIGMGAVNGLDLGNEAISFQARFSGRAFAVQFPVNSVLGIYARETGRGMIFSEEEPAPTEPTPTEPAPPTPPEGTPPAGGRRARLKVVK